MEAVGRVIEESTPHSFLFKVDIDRPISLHDYVFVEVNEVKEGKVEKVKVLAEVLEFTSKSPFATEELASGRQDRSYSYRILRAEILGYINEKGVMIRPKVAPDPNSQVYPAEDEFLQTYFKGNDDLLPITVGKLMNRHKVTVPVHLQNWQFHAGIFASSVDSAESFAYREAGALRIEPIGTLVDRFYSGDEEGIKASEGLEAACFDPSTHQVKWGQIEYVYRHRYHGNLVRLALETGRTVTVTPEHSVFVLRQGRIEQAEASGLREGDYVVATRKIPDNSDRMQTISIIELLSKHGRYKARGKKRFDSFYVYGFTDAFLDRIWPTLRKERPFQGRPSFRAHGVPGRYCHAITESELQQVRIGYHSKAPKIPAAVLIDEDMAELFGYYVAEGSTNIDPAVHYAVNFHLNVAESATIARRIAKIVRSKFGVRSVVRKDRGKGIRVVVHNKPLALLLSSTCGRGAENKTIPDAVINSPAPVRRAFFHAWVAGDAGVTVSSSLMNRAMYMLLLDGCIGSFGMSPPKQGGSIDGRKFATTKPAFHMHFPRPAYINAGISKLCRGHREPRYPVEQLPNPLRQFVIVKTKVPPHGRVTPKARRITTQEISKIAAYAGTPVKNCDATRHDAFYRRNRNRFLEADAGVLKSNQAFDALVSEFRSVQSILDSSLVFLRVRRVEAVRPTGKFVYDVSVPIAENFLAGFGGVFCHNTRAGKSYLAGRFMEEILHTTIFPVIVIDVHGDYVKMNQAKNGEKHDNFDVVVYYPPNAPKIAGVTAEEKSLDISPSQLSFEAFIELTGATVGELQSIALRNTLRDFQKRGSPFGLADVLNSFQSKLEETDDEGKQVLRGESRGRYQSIVDRLKDLEKDVSLPPVGMNIADLFQPKTLSVICLSGLRARIQDAYCSVIIELILNHLLKNKDKEDFMPVFLFIEEAHRVASVGSGARYSVGTISTAIREGAKFGLFLTLISQRPRSIDPDILSNVGNYAVLRITNAQDQQMIENASESFSHRLVEDLPSLNQGEAILVGPFVPLAAHITTLERKTVHYGVTPNLKKLMDSISKRIDKREKGKW